MSIYLIDFENTHAAGLNGITHLSPQDLVVVFLGAKDKTIPVDLVTQLTGPKVVASVEWKKANGSTPNYLDFQLVSYLALLITNPQVHENHYVIVTKDAGFDSAIDFWAARLKNISLERRPSISVTQNTQKTVSAAKSVKKAPVVVKKQEVIPEPLKKKVRAAVKDLGLKPQHFTVIYNAMRTAQTLPDFQSILDRGIRQPDSAPVFKALREVFTNYRTDAVTIKTG